MKKIAFLTVLIGFQLVNGEQSNSWITLLGMKEVAYQLSSPFKYAQQYQINSALKSNDQAIQSLDDVSEKINDEKKNWRRPAWELLKGFYNAPWVDKQKNDIKEDIKTSHEKSHSHVRSLYEPTPLYTGKNISKNKRPKKSPTEALIKCQSIKNENADKRQYPVLIALNALLNVKKGRHLDVVIDNFPKRYQIGNVNEVPRENQLVEGSRSFKATSWLHFIFSNKFLTGNLSKRKEKLELFTYALIKWGAEVNKKDYRERMPLHMALKNKHSLNAIKILIEAGADVNGQDGRGNTPLHYAMKHENHAAVKLLLEKGANANIQNNKEETPLLFAIKAIETLQAADDKSAHVNNDPFSRMNVDYAKCINVMLNTSYRPILNFDLKDSKGDSVRSILEKTKRYTSRTYPDTIRADIMNYENSINNLLNNLNDSSDFCMIPGNFIPSSSTSSASSSSSLNQSTLNQTDLTKSMWFE